MESNRREDALTITRTFSGHAHTGYVITNEDGAVAEVYASKRRGYFVRTEADLVLTDSLLHARSIATSLLA